MYDTARRAGLGLGQARVYQGFIAVTSENSNVTREQCKQRAAERAQRRLGTRDIRSFWPGPAGAAGGGEGKRKAGRPAAAPPKRRRTATAFIVAAAAGSTWAGGTAERAVAAQQAGPGWVVRMRQRRRLAAPRRRSPPPVELVDLAAASGEEEGVEEAEENKEERGEDEGGTGPEAVPRQPPVGAGGTTCNNGGGAEGDGCRDGGGGGGDQGAQDRIPPATDDPSRIWLPELVQRYDERLPPNERACTLRLVNKATAAQFRAPQHTAVRLSLPVPHHAFVWRWGREEALSGLTRGQREQLPRLTARSGSVANLEVLLAREDTYSRPLTTNVLIEAAGAGHLEACRWLRQQGCPWDEWVLRKAAGDGHRAVCEWLLASGCPWSEGGAGAAARGGHVGLVDWLLGTGRSLNVAGLLAGAAEGCNLPTLQHLHHTYLDGAGTPLPSANLVVAASAAGSATADWRAKVEWLEGRGYPRSAGTCTEAARLHDGQGRLEWLQQRGYPLTPSAAVMAGASGAVDVLQYVLDAGVELHGKDAIVASLVHGAVVGGHLAVLQALHARGLLHVQLGGALAESAAQRGHLTVVAWLVETLGAAAVLSTRVFAAAAGPRASECNRMELLAWLHEHGCPMGVRAGFHYPPS
ncbi:Ankyrin repeat domain-containing protein [Tetrabaena socialis]|uniref:Ankyrin repeat domain-containing protein n=1 Tax=Tetrabaena socialis TaxID=47790 RepID=A0A2J7ZYG8_9CHLO|nr:Ankyrin repeat domain-containing protein [Tetrabaena socialis]|eukprot:PNH05311.1 Ankyrin repeat domain-containing protein [Tetrabaena socialis]